MLCLTMQLVIDDSIRFRSVPTLANFLCFSMLYIFFFSIVSVCLLFLYLYGSMWPDSDKHVHTRMYELGLRISSKNNMVVADS